MNDTAITIRDLIVRAGRRNILAIENLQLPKGQFVGILGPNGAGKSTFLRCLLGLQRHAGGRVTVLGEPLAELGMRGLGLLRRRIGYVPQLLSSPGEIPLTVREVIAIGRTGIAGLIRPLRKKDWRIVDQWIERLGLASLTLRGYGEISGGEQRKVLIARAMVQQPDLLLLDEPTANLDLGWRERIVTVVKDLYASSGMTVILVSHDLEVLPPACGRVIVLERGRLVADGSPDDVLTDQRLETLYGPGLTVLKRGGRLLAVPAEVFNA
ncbi:MAG TPA: ABC transporter ATP-binding protein [Phycisphaerae bacterium]|mgnify:CR=1 FL=1|nr:ABC transporter ATP-binding protein [Phycisphaerae bacterium]HRR84121.1 ABC transporter ATP-binding protein [Phycisphaerae bacterium]